MADTHSADAAFPVVLAYKQPVRLASWMPTFYATVYSAEGYAVDRDMDPVAAVARHRERGWEMAATIFTGAALVNDGGAFHARQRAIADGAVTLAEGQIVSIEGRTYRVRVVPGNGGSAPVNSDPIKFIAVEG